MNDPHGAATRRTPTTTEHWHQPKGAANRRTPGPYQGPMKPKTLVCVTGCSQQGATPAGWQPKSPTEQPQTQHPENPGN